MRNKVLETFDEAVSDIPDGSSLMLGGFGPPGMPQNLTGALLRRGVKDLTVIVNRLDSSWSEADQGKLLERGFVRKVCCAFSASPHPSQVTEFERLHEAGLFEAELIPQGTMVERMRAAAAGIGAFYTPTGVGTEIAEGKEHKVINGRTYILEYPLPADYAFIRATRADTFGNLQYHMTQRNFNPVMAMASKNTFAEIEESIEEPGCLDPDHIHTPGIFIDRIVKIPPPPEGLWTFPSERRDR